jgi:hypothetical protein
MRRQVAVTVEVGGGDTADDSAGGVDVSVVVLQVVNADELPCDCLPCD